MKVTGFNGSARDDGNTAIIMRLVLDELGKEGIGTELIQFGAKDIAPCRGCFACRDRKNCFALKDDFSECFDKMVASDGILLGSPVYSADVTAKMKAFLERAGVVVATNPALLKHKVGAAVSAERRGGGLTAVDTMNHFFMNKEMIIAGSTYWNFVIGRNIGEVMQDEEGIRNMKNLGQNMAWLLKRLKG
jgi:multimeric flavodoxin WrbA